MCKPSWCRGTERDSVKSKKLESEQSFVTYYVLEHINMSKALSVRIRQTRFESVTQEAILDLLVAAAEVRSQLERIFLAKGISMPQYNVLRILRGKFPEGYARCEIIERMLERAPDVTRLIDRLQQRGLVERIPSTQDGRFSLARITPEGKALLDELQPELDTHAQFVGDRLGVAEQQELSMLCGKLL